MPKLYAKKTKVPAHPSSKNSKPRKKPNENKVAMSHRKAIFHALNQLRQASTNTLSTCFAIAMTLLLTTTLLLTLKTFQKITTFANTSNQISVYLKTELNEAIIQNLINNLKAEPLIKSLSFISPSEALAELKQQADYANVLHNISENPLPPVIQLNLNSTEELAIKGLVSQLKANPAIDTLHLDYTWLQRLSFLASLCHRISYALSIALSLGVILIITHAVQGATQRNQQEIYILQLIGAPMAYIRRPFLYLGSLMGLGAGLMTISLLFLIYLLIKQPLLQLLQSYNITYSNQFMRSHFYLLVLACSTLLGLLGAWIAFSKHAKPI